MVVARAIQGAASTIIWSGQSFHPNYFAKIADGERVVGFALLLVWINYPS
jgi:hypothetical protein